jgi:hypothetical protein
VGLPPFVFVDKIVPPIEMFPVPVEHWAVPTILELRYLSRARFYGLATMNPVEFRNAHYAAAWRLVSYLSLGPPKVRKHFQRFLQLLSVGDADAMSAWRTELANVDLTGIASVDLEALQVEVPYLAPTTWRPTARELSSGEADLHVAWLLPPHSRKQREVIRALTERAATDPRVRAEAVELSVLVETIANQAPAFERLAQALTQDPRAANLLILLIELKSATYDPSIVATDAETMAAADILRQLPESLRGLAALVSVDLAIGQKERAHQYSQRATALFPKAYTAWDVHSQALAALGRTAEAVRANARAFALISPENTAGVSLLNGQKAALRGE